jgi:hypothetical protein
MEETVTEYLYEQISELRDFHKGLASVVERDNKIVVTGVLSFEASAEGLEVITGCFDIELLVPHNYPDMLPQVKETGGNINSNYNHINADATLCLAVPIEERRIFLEEPTLLGFVNRIVIPYLYGFSYWKKHGLHPFNEAEHGAKGIAQHYINALNLSGDNSALSVICFLMEHGYRGHHDCPCGSGRRVRSCHGPMLLSLHQTHTPHTLQADFLAILNVCLEKVEKKDAVIPEPLLKKAYRLYKQLDNG